MPNRGAASLRGRVLRAGLWLLSGHAMTQVIRLASNLIMTRLLAPEMFGLMSIAVLIIYGVHMVSDLGLRQGIVRHQRGYEPRFLGTTWAVQIIRGCLLWSVGLAFAATLYLSQQAHLLDPGKVYADPLLPWVIAFISAMSFISGFESTKIAMSNRGLAQGRIAQIEVLCQAIGAACMIAWAWVDRSIWALVAGSIVSNLVRTMASHFLIPGQPDRLAWDRESLREIRHFGKWVFGASMLLFAANSGDRLLLGGLVSPELLGLYAIGYLIVDAVNQVFVRLFAAVSFPALSEMARERPEALKKAYYRLRLPIDVFALFVAGMLFTAGDALVALLYDDRYMVAGHVIQILSISFIFSRYGATEACCLAFGEPRILFAQNAVHGFVLYAGLPVAFHFFGFDGALWTIGIYKAFGLLPLIRFQRRHGLLDVRKELIVLPSLLVGIASGAIFSFLVAAF